jgi:hypothetical protein
MVAAVLASAAAHAADPAPIDAGPYVPSLTSVVSDMLKLAEVGPKDFVIDLGSGDGRIVLTAAKVFGARGFGVEIKEKLVKESNDAARLQGVADRVKFMNQDLFKTDISQATVLTMYLLPKTVNMLKDKLLTELRPGTRIISHDYGLTDWQSEKTLSMDLEDKVAISGVTTTLIFLYKVPAKVAGNWVARVPAGISKDPVNLSLSTQMVTRLRGRMRLAGKDVIIDEGAIHGEVLEFRLFAGAARYDFSGSIKAGTIEGTVEGAGTKGTWSAALAK